LVEKYDTSYNSIIVYTEYYKENKIKTINEIHVSHTVKFRVHVIYGINQSFKMIKF